MQSGIGKMSCNKTALKRCTSTETLWNRKAPSLSSPEDEEIFLPKLSKIGMLTCSKVPRFQPRLERRGNVGILFLLAGSGKPSVRLSVPSITRCNCSARRVCCRGPRGQAIWIDCCTMRLKPQARPPFDPHPQQHSVQLQLRAVSCLQRRMKLNTDLLGLVCLNDINIRPGASSQKAIYKFQNVSISVILGW